jgi:hypothetical protein
MFPHTVTVYNVALETDLLTFKDKLTKHITVLRGVLLDETKAANVRTSGLENADAATLYIPNGVEAVDGETGAAKEYLPAREYEHLKYKSGAWTLSVDGSGGMTFFILGEVVEPDESVDYEVLRGKYDHVYKVTKIDDKRFGGLAHIEVGGA